MSFNSIVPKVPISEFSARQDSGTKSEANNKKGFAEPADTRCFSHFALRHAS